VKLLQTTTEKADLIKYLKEFYPNVYNSYSDKTVNSDMKFLFAGRVENTKGMLLKTFLHYWKSTGDQYSVNLLTGDPGIIFNLILKNKEGKVNHAQLTLSESNLPQNFDITFQSHWKKGVKDKPYGIALFDISGNEYCFYAKASGNASIEKKDTESSNIHVICEKAIEFNEKSKILSHHKIKVTNHKVKYYLNDAEIGNTDLNNGLSHPFKINFVVHDKQRVVFDYLQISEQ
jgi:hypothetical protein